VSDPYEPAPPAGGNELAVVALVVAVANVVFGSFLGLFVPLVPAVITVIVVILGHVSLAQIRRRGEEGRAMAISALVIGYLGIAWVFVLLVLALTSAAIGMALLGF